MSSEPHCREKLRQTEMEGVGNGEASPASPDNAWKDKTDRRRDLERGTVGLVEGTPGTGDGQRRRGRVQ